MGMVIHYLYFDHEDEARAAGGDAADRGFRVRVSAPDTYGQWALVCERDGHGIDPEAVLSNSHFFGSIAERHTGDYDGWEALVS